MNQTSEPLSTYPGGPCSKPNTPDWNLCECTLVQRVVIGPFSERCVNRIVVHP
jgi:hypothetical protein